MLHSFSVSHNALEQAPLGGCTAFFVSFSEHRLLKFAGIPPIPETTEPTEHTEPTQPMEHTTIQRQTHGAAEHALQEEQSEPSEGPVDTAVTVIKGVET